MITGRYKIFDHTADVGLRAWGISLPHLFWYVTQGMLAIIGSGSQNGKIIRYSLSVTEDTAEELLLQWLKEILFLIEQQNIMVQRFHFETLYINKHSSNGCYLKASIYGCKYYKTRHDFCTEIKAITRHLFQVKKSLFIWKANLIFDV